MFRTANDVFLSGNNEEDTDNDGNFNITKIAYHHSTEATLDADLNETYFLNENINTKINNVNDEYH